MRPPDLVRQLEFNAATLGSLFVGATPEQVRWRPEPSRWSMLEVLCHLLDEERDDFRTRLRLTLEDSDATWPPIDPEGWAREREYNTRDLPRSLAAFAEERAASLAWLAGLQAPDWDRTHSHPGLGTLRAGDLLAAWVAHDFLHLRQLADLRAAQLAEAVQPYSPEYAG